MIAISKPHVSLVLCAIIVTNCACSENVEEPSNLCAELRCCGGGGGEFVSTGNISNYHTGTLGGEKIEAWTDGSVIPVYDGIRLVIALPPNTKIGNHSMAITVLYSDSGGAEDSIAVPRSMITSGLADDGSGRTLLEIEDALGSNHSNWHFNRVPEESRTKLVPGEITFDVVLQLTDESEEVKFQNMKITVIEPPEE